MCAVEDTGRYSVKPSTMAMIMAFIKSIKVFKDGQNHKATTGDGKNGFRLFFSFQNF